MALLAERKSLGSPAVARFARVGGKTRATAGTNSTSLTFIRAGWKYSPHPRSRDGRATGFGMTIVGRGGLKPLFQ
jgi:hypothetical protein